MSTWIFKSRNIQLGLLCKIGLHSPGEWKRSVEPDYYASSTLVVKRRWCSKCGAMQYRELERHA